MSAGQYVMKYGDTGYKFYIMMEGAVGVLLPTRGATGDKTVEHEVATLAAGDCFGELALLNDQRRSASILCKSAWILLTLEKDAYEQTMVDENAKFMVKYSYLEK